MKQYASSLRQTIAWVLLLFIAGGLAISGYTLWRLRADALARGFELAAMHAQRYQDLLTQSLHVSELIASNVVTHDELVNNTPRLAADFRGTLRRLPFLRSMSLLDGDGRILVSSNPDNVGLRIALDNYLPASAAAGDDMLRLGPPWVGRDFAGGRPGTPQAPSPDAAATFIPLAQTLVFGARRVTLLLALNPDYFVNYIAQEIGAGEGRVDVLRYDGTRLLASDPSLPPGAWRDLRALSLGEAESGRFASTGSDGQPTLTAFRASPLYPLVVLTEIDRDYALAHWATEARTVLGIVGTTLLAISLLSVAFYRRQLLLIEQRVEFRRLQQINATVFEASLVAILVTDDEATILSLNAAYARLSGYRPEELIGHPLFGLLTTDGIALFKEKTARRPDCLPNSGDGASDSFELEHRCKDGTLIWMEVNSTPERDARGLITGYHRICRNITERKQMEDRVRQLAFHDTLTQLPNRRLLGDRLHQAQAASSRSGCYGALMFLDLDNFKPLNDAHGHGVGDLLLIEVAHRLRHCTREADTVARFGGDEFVVMLGALGRDHAESVAQATLIAEKISAALAEPYRLASAADGAPTIEHRSSASIGVVLFLGQQTCADDLLKWADAAMYQAKQAGPSRIRFYPSGAREEAVAQ